MQQEEKQQHERAESLVLPIKRWALLDLKFFGAVLRHEVVPITIWGRVKKHRAN